MTFRPKPLPPENDEVVFGVSSVLLTGSAQFSAGEDDAGRSGSISAAVVAACGVPKLGSAVPLRLIGRARREYLVWPYI
jgi:hypothetical protein